MDVNNIFMNSAKSTHRDKTRARLYISFDFIFFPHLNMQIMGPNNTKNWSKSVIFLTFNYE